MTRKRDSVFKKNDFKNMKMNMNIRKAFGGVCIPILALGVFFASCTKELSSEVVPGGGGKGGESEVTLKLQVPGTAAGAKTRAVTPKEENEIDDLYVLAFKVDKDDGQETFDYCVAAKKQSTGSPGGSEHMDRKPEGEGLPADIRDDSQRPGDNQEGERTDQCPCKKQRGARQDGNACETDRDTERG